jgi:TsgA-like MFS transporter
MNGRTVAATAVAIATYVVMGGLFTQSGVILGSAAAWYQLAIPEAAVLFSYLVGGNLAGLIVCMFVFDVLPIQRVLILAYVALFAGVALIGASHAPPLGALAFGLCGFGAGVGLSAGAVIIAKLFTQRARAVAFLATDCTFSLSGYVFPALAANAIAAGRLWQSGYLAVAGVALVLLIASFGVRLPATRRSDRAAAPLAAQRVRLPSTALLPIGLFALALGFYLCGQGAFLIWAPNDLQSSFGLSAPAAAPIVGAFWGPSIFGLVAAALIVTRIPPRIVAIGAAMLAVMSLATVTLAHDVHAYFTATLAFGFTSTCLFKLLISIGSEQLTDAPPQLVTFMLLAASIGGTIAPALSAAIVRNHGAHAGIEFALVSYGGTLIAALAALTVERRGRVPAALPLIEPA